MNSLADVEITSQETNKQNGVLLLQLINDPYACFTSTYHNAACSLIFRLLHQCYGWPIITKSIATYASNPQ
jgi:hypothetical protein